MEKIGPDLGTKKLNIYVTKQNLNIMNGLHSTSGLRNVAKERGCFSVVGRTSVANPKHKYLHYNLYFIYTL